MRENQILHSFSLFLSVVPHQSKLTVTNILNGNKGKRTALGFLKLVFDRQFLVLHLKKTGNGGEDKIRNTGNMSFM